jgi:hypothetical protein
VETKRSTIGSREKLMGDRCGQSQESRLELRLHLSRRFSGTDNLDTN